MRIRALLLCTILVACGDQVGGVRVLGVAQPLDDTTCAVDPAGPLIDESLVLDVRNSRALYATVVINNDTDRVLSKVRLEARWGRDSGFVADVGPLVVPELHPILLCVP